MVPWIREEVSATRDNKDRLVARDVKLIGLHNSQKGKGWASYVRQAAIPLLGKILQCFKASSSGTRPIASLTLFSILLKQASHLFKFFSYIINGSARDQVQCRRRWASAICFVP